MSRKMIVGGISLRQRQKRFRQFKHVVVRLDVRVRLVWRRTPEIIQPDAGSQRYGQEYADRALHETQMFLTNQQDRTAEDVQQRPAKTHDTPRRLVLNQTVSDEAARAVNRQVSQIEILKLLAKQR